MEMFIQSSQQQMNAMLLLVENISEELSYSENIHREISRDIFVCILLICRLIHWICFQMTIFRRHYLVRLLLTLFCLTTCILNANAIIYLMSIIFSAKSHQKKFICSVCMFVWKLKVSVWEININLQFDYTKNCARLNRKIPSTQLIWVRPTDLGSLALSRWS